MLNLCAYTGRLTKDPELRYTRQNEIPVTSFRIAVQRDFAKEGEDDVDFMEVVAWRSTAEFICKYFAKGKMITVSGSNRNRKWTDQHGQNRITTELIADRAYFADSKREDGGTGSGPAPDPFDDETEDFEGANGGGGYMGDDDLPY